MDILVNDRKIQYELEGEESLSEVLAGLERWIAGNRAVIKSLTVDRAPVSPDRLDQLGQVVSKVGTVEIYTQSSLQLAADSLETLQDYIRYLNQQLLQGDVIESHDRILEGLDMTAETLDRSLRLLAVNPAVVYSGNTGGEGSGELSLEDMLAELQAQRAELARRYVTEQDAGVLGDTLAGIRALFPRVLGWALLKENLAAGEKYDRTFLPEALKDLHRAAQRRVNAFEEIGEHLQVGRDREAFQRLSVFLEFFHELVTLLSLVQAGLKPGAGDLPALLGEIKGVLEEVEHSMNNADMVSVGDLVEYELGERYLEILQVLKTMRDLAGK